MFWFIPLSGPFAVFYKEVGEKEGQPGVYLAGETRLLVNLPEIDGIADLVDWQTGTSMPIEQHLFLIPMPNC